MEYNTGALAKKSNISVRTIRYYDKIGLLKPSKIKDNGYRIYSEEDYVSLQLIISLKTLGFSLSEIQAILINKNDKYIKESLELQMNLLSKKITNLSNLKYNLGVIIDNLETEEFSLESIGSFVEDTEFNEKLVDQYYNARNLDIRANLHNKYRTNSTPWFSWVQKQIDIKGKNRIIDIGCGNGLLWKGLEQSLRNRELFLCDISEGMIEEARSNLGNDYSYVVANCENLRFQNSYFNMVVANHMLFYLRNLDDGLLEIHRILKDDGVLYASAYGKNHMLELNELVSGFDDRIALSPYPLYEIFGVENGKSILNKYFKTVDYVEYEDSLLVNSVEDIITYVLSCHGNQMDFLKGRLDEFEVYVEEVLKTKGNLHIQKEVGLFIARNKKQKFNGGKYEKCGN